MNGSIINIRYPAIPANFMTHKILPFCLFLLLLSSCTHRLKIPHSPQGVAPITGNAFYKQAAAYNWQQRDSLFLDYFSKGNIPAFFFQFVPINVAHTDSNGKTHTIVFYCSPDYAMIGTLSDWARVPLTPMAAQVLADSLKCFLPTRRMVDLIYQQSQVKLEPVPMYAFRDSTVTMWQHHLIIEGQRAGRKGLISGIKKDVVICSDSSLKGRTNRVAIYGWHKLDGRPIQPLYTGHVNWYVDYSHGIRLIYSKIKVDGKWMDYETFFRNPLICPALFDEAGTLRLRL